MHAVLVIAALVMMQTEEPELVEPPASPAPAPTHGDLPRILLRTSLIGVAGCGGCLAGALVPAALGATAFVGDGAMVSYGLTFDRAGGLGWSILGFLWAGIFLGCACASIGPATGLGAGAGSIAAAVVTGRRWVAPVLGAMGGSALGFAVAAGLLVALITVFSVGILWDPVALPAPGQTAAAAVLVGLSLSTLLAGPVTVVSSTLGALAGLVIRELLLDDDVTTAPSQSASLTAQRPPPEGTAGEVERSFFRRHR